MAVLAAACGGSGKTAPTATAALRSGNPLSTADWVSEDIERYRLRFKHPPDWRLVQAQGDQAGGNNPVVVLHPGSGNQALSYILVSTGSQQVPAGSDCTDAAQETMGGYPLDICRFQRDIPGSFPFAPNEQSVRFFTWRLPDGIVYLKADISIAAPAIEAPVAEAVMRTFEKY